MTRALAALAAAALLTAGAGCGDDDARQAGSTSGGFAGSPAGDGPALDFVLSDAAGERVRLSDQRGRVVVLAFLYTSCRDVCPVIAHTLNTVLRRLDDRRDEVRVLAVSVDPARDTAFAIREFRRVHRLLPGFLYVTGTERELRPVWQSYNVLASTRNADVIDHSAPIVLIDASGDARLIHDSHAEPDAILGDVRLLLDS